MAGATYSTNFPTANPLQGSSRGMEDAFIAKINSTNGPGIVFSSGNLAFLNQVIGTTGTQSVTLYSVGNLPLTISSMTATGDFAETNNCGTSLASGATCTINVSFTPTAVGTRIGSIIVNDNAAGNPHTISLSGVGGIPLLATGGVVDAATNQPTLVPGSIGTAYGLALGQMGQATTPTLPRQLGTTQVTQILFPDLENVAAPLFYASAGQVNFQVPWELSGATHTRVVAAVNGVQSTPQTIALASAAPGIFTLTTAGQGAITDAFSGVIAAAPESIQGAISVPAARGSFVSIYCDGLGPVSNRPATGAPGPSNPLAQVTAPVTASIGGITIQPQFAGLAPGMVGVYQVNVQLPANAPTGNAVPVTLAVGGAISNVVTVAIQ